jgi:mRNA interferase HigB
MRWRNFLEVRQLFQDADAVDEYVIFNIRRNRYRLICIIHYAREKDGHLTEGHIYIRSVLTHNAYNDRANWNKGVRP